MSYVDYGYDSGYVLRQLVSGQPWQIWIDAFLLIFLAALLSGIAYNYDSELWKPFI